jgi:hypothetical protein
VPFTAVLNGPQRTTTDNYEAPSTCAVPHPRRRQQRPIWLCKQVVDWSQAWIGLPRPAGPIRSLVAGTGAPEASTPDGSGIPWSAGVLLDELELGRWVAACLYYGRGPGLAGVSCAREGRITSATSLVGWPGVHQGRRCSMEWQLEQTRARSPRRTLRMPASEIGTMWWASMKSSPQLP